MRRAVECGAVDPSRVVQIGIRGPQNFTDGWDWAEASGFTVLYMERCVELGVAGVVDAARAVVERGGGGGGPVYLSFDIDALDPAFAPGTGTPECGGFTTREAMQLLRGLRGPRRGCAARTSRGRAAVRRRRAGRRRVTPRRRHVPHDIPASLRKPGALPCPAV